MTAGVARVVAYRFRATFSRRLGGYLTLLVLIGLLGGIAMGSVAAARRTQASYPAFLAETNASTLTMSTYGTTNGEAANNYSPKLLPEIAHLPDVKKVEAWVGVGILVLKRDGAPNLVEDLNSVGSVNRLFFDEDRATVIAGRMPNPNSTDEFVTTALGASSLGIGVGDVVPMGAYSAPQFGSPLFGTPKLVPKVRIDMHLVGIVVFNNEVIQDDADRTPTDMLFTPALTRVLLADNSSEGTWYALQLAHGDRDLSATEAALIRLLPSGSDPNFSVTSITETKVELAVKPESIALGVFGVIAALAALAIAALTISRQLRSEDEEGQILRALGATPSTGVADGLVGVLAAVVAGSILAAIVAAAISPLSPLGPIRQVYHPSGIAFDWTVLGLGVLVLIGGLSAIAIAIAYQGAAHRQAARSRTRLTRQSRAVRLANAMGLPVSSAVGLRFALTSGQGRSAVPARSVLVGATLAIAMVTGTLTFSSGLQTLISHPALYGWNWAYTLSGENGVPPAALTALDHDPDVSGWSGFQSISVQIDHLTVPILAVEGDHAAVAPPILSGHSVDAHNQIDIGATTLALLHKHIGDTVTFSFGSPNTAPLYLPPTPLVIVGTATFPAIGGEGNFADHPSMGTGALLSAELSRAFIQAVSNPDPNLGGPGLVFVRLRSGVSTTAGFADMNRVTALADAAFAKDRNAYGDTVNVIRVQRPAEIVNYESTGATPVVLAIGLAVGAVLALALTLIASVRRRRRDLALLKSLGFTARQLAAAIAWQASTIAVVSAAVGVPIGIVAGRELWELFARDINAVPQPTVPVSLFLVVIGAFVLANLVAAIPARLAARTPAALALRSE